jgi:hypothetical protein
MADEVYELANCKLNKISKRWEKYCQLK